MSETHHFAKDAVLLCGKREGSERGTEKSGVGGGCQVQTKLTVEKLDIGETKRRRLRGGACVFAGSQ